MAIRQKTIEYSHVHNTATNAAAATVNLGTITVYLPETTSRTFVNVYAHVFFRDANAAAASFTGITVAPTLGAAGAGSLTFTDSIANTGENLAAVIKIDATSYFETNFGAGTSQTLATSVTISGTTSQTICVKYVITYEYDDSATTKVKTVRIPIIPGSAISILGTTASSWGTTSIPALDTYLPEASKTYRDIFFEIYSHDATGAATDYTIYGQLDAEAETAVAVCEAALITGLWNQLIWKRTDMTTNTTHEFKMRSSLASRFSNPAAVLVVTYEYNEASTTSVFNSILLTPFTNPTVTHGTTAADGCAYTVNFLVAEPTTLDLKNSGVLYRFGGSTGITFGTSVGALGESTHTVTAGSMNCGQLSVMQPITSSGFDLVSGDNSLTLKFRTGTSNEGSNLSALVFLNYTSGKATQGTCAHNHTVIHTLQGTSLDNTILTSATKTITFNESDYYFNNITSHMDSWLTVAFGTVSMEAEVNSGEYNSDGWVPTIVSSYKNESTAELSFQQFSGDATDKFNRWPSDTSGKMNLLTGRRWRLCSTGASTIWSSWSVFMTYHSITKSFTDTVTDNGTPVVGATVYLHDATTGQRLKSTTTNGSGQYTFSWYSELKLVFVSCQNGSKVGRSVDFYVL